jgi:DNA-binding NarL/FixJ family response regulator
MLAGEPGLELIGEATNGREAVELCIRLQPDLVLLGARMPELDGLAATRAIKQSCPSASVLLLTTHETPEVIEAVRAGAAGYLLKDMTRQELIAAVRRVLRGESIPDRQLAAHVLQRAAGEAPHPSVARADRLTRREHEVLQLVAQGQTNREIAEALMVSTGTIKNHVEHIIAKLGVSDRTQAAVRAIELGILRPTSE